MVRQGRPGRNGVARSFRQLKRFRHFSNSDRVFGTHRRRKISCRGVVATKSGCIGGIATFVRCRPTCHSSSGGSRVKIAEYVTIPVSWWRVHYAQRTLLSLVTSPGQGLCHRSTPSHSSTLEFCAQTRADDSDL